MFVLDHVSITVKDIDRARRFYDAVMKALGVEKVYDRKDALGYGIRCRANDDSHTYLAIYASKDAMVDSRRHWCFKASTRAHVKAFYEAALANGGRDDGPPGIRSSYHDQYFAAFVFDPEDNRIEAVCHREEET